MQPTWASVERPLPVKAAREEEIKARKHVHSASANLQMPWRFPLGDRACITLPVWRDVALARPEQKGGAPPKGSLHGQPPPPLRHARLARLHGQVAQGCTDLPLASCRAFRPARRARCRRPAVFDCTSQIQTNFACILLVHYASVALVAYSVGLWMKKRRGDEEKKRREEKEKKSCSKVVCRPSSCLPLPLPLVSRAQEEAGDNTSARRGGGGVFRRCLQAGSENQTKMRREYHAKAVMHHVAHAMRDEKRKAR